MTAPAFVRRLNPNKVRKGGFTIRLDKVVVIEKGHPLEGIELVGGITHVISKKAGDMDFTGVGTKRREGVDIGFLLENQPDYIKELAKDKEKV